MSGGISIIIPAYLEQGNIEAAIDSVLNALEGIEKDYEIIVIDDGSPDKTGEFARIKAQTNERIRVATNAKNEGFGYSFARGVKMATKGYITVFPGDNDMASASLKELMNSRFGAALVISYMRPTLKRSLLRRTLSRGFVFLMNSIFGLKLKYYIGAFICKTELLRSIPIRSTGLAALAECIIRLIKKGTEYRVIYFEHAGRKNEQSKALTWRSFKSVIATIVNLVKDIYWAHE